MRAWVGTTLMIGAIWTAVVLRAAGGSGLSANVAGGPPVAPALLSQTGLYADIATGRIDPSNQPFSPQYPLWTDGAEKSRWVRLPAGAVIDTSDPQRWRVPVGTRFWKEFRFAGRKVETRLLWRATATQWVFASYIWNVAQTEADRADDAGVFAVADLGSGKQHHIPSVSDCQACHGSQTAGPLGFNALQLSTDRDPNAVHGEPLEHGMVTLASLAAEGRLSPPQPDLVARPPRIKASSPTTRAVIGYLAANCGSCHNSRGEIAVLGPSLAPADVIDGDAVARRLVGHPSRWQVPDTPEGTSVLLDAATPSHSAMLVRMRSRRPSSQMPPLGTVVRDAAAIALLERWVASDLPALVTRSSHLTFP